MPKASQYSHFGKNPISESIDKEDFKKEFLFNLSYEQGVTPDRANTFDKYNALAQTVHRLLRAQYNDTFYKTYSNPRKPKKVVCYLSAEYLLGKQLKNNLHAMGIEEMVKQVLNELNIDYRELLEIETEPALGNGGLGRLAACFLDSMATLNIPSISYGIRYEFGMFKQELDKGFQQEVPEYWLKLNNPWEHVYLRNTKKVGFGGIVKKYTDKDGVQRKKWVPANFVDAVPYNYMVPGFNTAHVNLLRLWSAKSTSSFNINLFNQGFYQEAAESEVSAENITKVLYPEDSTLQGKQLRLQQQYFFVAASIRDILDRSYKDWKNEDLSDLHERAVFQLNDTHPVIAVPELMRILIDEKFYDWDAAWDIVSKCFNYTCHTLMPEALEIWPEDLFQSVLPRHLEIIDKINRNFISSIYKIPGIDLRQIPNLSIIQEVPFRAVRMAYLATIASQNVNGVAALHSELLKSSVFKAFNSISPEKFINVTNGISPRRFIHTSNPKLSELITDAIGTDWLTDLNALESLKPLAEDAAFVQKFLEVKRLNKIRYSDRFGGEMKFQLNPDSLVDSMIKRIHEYKRQHLKLLHIVSIYQKFITGQIKLEDIQPRTFIFAGKAAPGYHMAKEIIRLSLAVFDKINHTPGLNERIQCIFHPNYNVTASSMIIPATDLSEQISQAGKEASGTSNMKFVLNGSLVVGTLDGANVEIIDKVGADNFYLFGMDVQEVDALWKSNYQSYKYYDSDPELKAALDLIGSGEFGDNENFLAVIDNLLNQDRYMVLADFRSYMDIQPQIEADFRDQALWAKKSIINIASSGFFSSDRSIRDYLSLVWHVPSI